jgi:DNA-binding transcriptional ArsR family regulator
MITTDPDLAVIGRTLADTHRSRFLLALLGGEELSAGELAARSGASPSLASAHLAKLLDAGLVTATRDGRQRYYRVATAQVAEALEGLIAIAPPRKPSGLREARRGEAIRRARTCYDHLAGCLGVALTESLEERELLRPGEGVWELTARGEAAFADLGIDVDDLRGRRRAFIRSCLDWTERRPHLAGALGAALATRFFELAWIRRLPATRAVVLTPAGEAELRARFGVEV